jgi:hypothetical protein
MRMRLVLIALSCLLLQQTLEAQEQSRNLDPKMFQGPNIMITTGEFKADFPKATLGLGGDVGVEDLVLEGPRFEQAQTNLKASSWDRARIMVQAKKHRLQFQQQLILAEFKALQQGLYFCHGFRTGNRPARALEPSQ